VKVARGGREPRAATTPRAASPRKPNTD
jgi:hypothetical protein